MGDSATFIYVSIIYDVYKESRNIRSFSVSADFFPFKLIKIVNNENGA